MLKCSVAIKVAAAKSISSSFRHFSSIDGTNIKILKNLSEQYSYDIFSLRIQLRNMGIEVDDNENLKLSHAKQGEHRVYMKQFTQRLILEVFGSDDAAVRSYDDILKLFKNPDEARRIYTNANAPGTVGRGG